MLLSALRCGRRCEAVCQRSRRGVIDKDGRPLHLSWLYDRAETIADGVVHVLGVALAVAGAIVLAILGAAWMRGPEIPAVAIYLTALVAGLGISAAYNMWPATRVKWLLRRFDHSAIYLLIAGTYTPFVVHFKDAAVAIALLGVIWVTAIAGILVKLLLPGRFDRLSVALYLLLGWSGVGAYESVTTVLPPGSLWLLAAGGVLYSVGVIFHVWRTLRFQNAI
ncbi:MAG: hemolysin III family protein, partial [Variibacter sp.]|nr:hemolysin III family protein [Variibacter sp.]